MKVLQYGLNFSPELTGIGKYSGEMVEWMSQHGIDVMVITAPPYYPEWKIRDGYSAWCYQKEYIHGIEVFRSPIYIPKKPTTISRLLHLISYSISSFPLLIRAIFWKPDVVLFIQPTLFSSLGALFLAKITGAKSVMHIQDYEIDAMFGLGLMEKGRLFRLVTSIESWIMKSFDMVSTISYSMMENAKRKGVPESNLFFFPNWADTDFVKPNVDGSALKSEWGFAEFDKVILYAGNIGKKQGLELILDAAERLKYNMELKFVIVGAGAHADTLKQDSKSRGLDNVYFKPLQPWKYVPDMLAMADIHLVLQRKGAADVVLPSKLTNILSAGGYAVVTAESDTELGILAKRFPGIYKCIYPEDSGLLVETIQSYLDMDLTKPNQIARDYALRYLSVNSIISRFQESLKKLCQN